MHLTVTSKEKGTGVFIVYPNGSLDSNTYNILESKIDSLLAVSPKMIVFDMGKLDYISSAGVRVIFKTKKAMNGKVTFVNLKPQIKKVFDIIKALPTMRVFSSVKELDQYLHKMQEQAMK